MKQKIKKVFENAVWWSGVAMVGLILGISLQFVRAWTEPTDAPPGGNVGAPINTGGNFQWKGLLGDVGVGLGIHGALETFGFKMPTGAGEGKVLTSDADGFASWANAAGSVGAGGSCFTYYCGKDSLLKPNPGNKCEDHFGTQKYCPAGFDQSYALGDYGFCWASSMNSLMSFPPGGTCPPTWGPATGGDFMVQGSAYVCCQN